MFYQGTICHSNHIAFENFCLLNVYLDYSGIVPSEPFECSFPSCPQVISWHTSIVPCSEEDSRGSSEDLSNSLKLPPSGVLPYKCFCFGLFFLLRYNRHIESCELSRQHVGFNAFTASVPSWPLFHAGNN